MNDGLKDKHRDAILKVLGKHPKIERAVLFGSRAMGTFTATSDVDIALYGDLSLKEQARIAEELDELSVPYNVDLVRMKTVTSPELLEHIKEHGKTWKAKRHTIEGKSSRESKPIHVPASCGELPQSWTWARLDEVSEGIFDCPHSTPKLTEIGPYVVRTQDIITGVFRAEQAARVSDETYAERIARVTPSRGDLLYSREGTYFGIAAEVPENTRVCLGQRMVLIRPKPEILDFGFLRYWLNSPIMAAHIHGYRDGSVAERLNLPTIRALPVLLPPLETQKAIAAVLGALDDKIELNRRMNATLEAMARALFQSWFVDYDPVRAKLDGRQPPNLDPATAALFPDSFQDSELGHIPKGWKVERVSDVMTFEGGTQPPASEFIDEPREGYVRLVQIRDFYTSGHVTFVPETKKLRKFATDDLMLARYGSSGNAAKGSDSLGRVCRGMSGAYNVALVKVIPLRPIREFLFCFLKSDAFQGTIKGMGARSVQSGFRKEDLDVIYLVTAPPQVHEAFERFAVDVWRKTYANDQESRTLATLRDTLLPKLLRGEIALKIETDAIV